VPPFDPERLLTALARRQVRYVLIGAVAARLHGFPRMTADADITPARSDENLERLAAALRDLAAKVHTESVPEGGSPVELPPASLPRRREPSGVQRGCWIPSCAGIE
jgi:hypothetical protein